MVARRKFIGHFLMWCERMDGKAYLQSGKALDI